MTKGESQNLSTKHSKINDKNISTFLLELCGFDRPLLRKNKQNATRQLSYRDLAKISLIDEERIITEDSPIYNGQYFDRTVEQAILKLLLTGNDDSGIEEIEEDKMYKSRIKGKLELIDSYIENTTIKLEVYKENFKKPETTTIESRLEELNVILTDSSREIEKLAQRKAKLYNRITELKSNLILKNELLSRFILLKEHYESDISRLKFITQGEDFFSQLSSTNCSICGGNLDKEHYDCLETDSEQSSSIMNSINMELIKIQKKKIELIKTISKEKEDIATLNTLVENFSSELVEVESSIQDKLKPIQDSSAKKIDSLMAQLSNIHEVKNLNAQLTNYFQERASLIDLQEKRPSVAEYQGKTSYMVLKALCEKIKEILDVWQFNDITTLNFDTSYDSYDIVINGKDRSAFGKGYRAILYSAFVLALLEYCTERDLPTTGHIMLDSPLTTFQGKEANNSRIVPIVEETVSQDIEKSFFRDLADLRNELQVIIFDNKDPDDYIKEKINYIHFTKGKSEGRYGFFPV